MPTDAYYRQIVTQVQTEYARAVQALESQVATLTQHNALLQKELTLATQARKDDAATIRDLEQALKRQAAAAEQAQREASEKEDALRLEIAALQSLVQQEQAYWTRYDDASRADRDRLTHQVAEAHADAIAQRETNARLVRDMKALQNRVDTAVAMSQSFEQRLAVVAREKQDQQREMETKLSQYRRKLHDKRAQTKILTEALVRLQEQRGQSGESSHERGSSSDRKERPPPTREATSRPSTRRPTSVEKQTNESDHVSIERRLRKREWTLSDEVPADLNVVTASTSYKSKRIGSSRVRTSPSSSSSELSPRATARAAPYKRPPSVATTTPTTSDGNSFQSNSSAGSVRSVRSLRHVTARRTTTSTSRKSSDSDHMDMPSPRRTEPVGVRGPKLRTERLERELSGLRRRLDSCVPEATARW